MEKQKATSKPLLQVIPPDTPCDKCIAGCGKIFQDEIVFVYCGHNHAGSVYDIESKQWHIFSPISETEFKRLLNYVVAFSRLARKQQIKGELRGNPTFH